MMLDALDEEERAYMLKAVPAPMRLLMPILVERPIVVTPKGAALCRPAERLEAIL